MLFSGSSRSHSQTRVHCRTKQHSADSKFLRNSWRIQVDRDVVKHMCGRGKLLHRERKGNKVGNPGGLDREVFSLETSSSSSREWEAGVNRE